MKLKAPKFIIHKMRNFYLYDIIIKSSTFQLATANFLLHKELGWIAVV